MMQSKMLLVLACAGLAHAESSLSHGVWSYKDASCDKPTYTIDNEEHSNCASGAVSKDSKCIVPSGYWCWVSTTCKEAGTNAEGPICEILEKPSGQELNPNPSPATQSIRSTRILDPMRGFKDMPDARFLKFPPTMIGRDALVPSVRTKAGYDVTLECVNPGGAGGHCDHFVILYSCPPCTHADGGNLVATLLADGWVPHHCGTAMDLDGTRPSHLHQMVIYHKQTQSGPALSPGSDSIVPSELLEFAFFANTPATSYCPAITDETECNDHLPAECAWKEGSCVSDLCPKGVRPHGPWSTEQHKCSVCPHDPSESIFIPALKI